MISLNGQQTLPEETVQRKKTYIETAQQDTTSGSYRWNCDIFVWQAWQELTHKDFYINAVNASGKVQFENCRGNLVCNDVDTEIRLEKIEKCAIVKIEKS